MKKILFTLCALVLCGTMFGTTTVFNLKTVPNLATEYGWQDTTNPFHAYQSFKLDDNITVTANSNTTAGTSTGNMNGIYSGGRWFVYKVDNNGSFSIKAKDGYIIKTIAITYGVGDNGILISEPGSTTQIASNTAIEINAQTATLYVGNSTGANKGRLTITQFVVTYSLISSSDETYTEKFDSCGIADQIVTKKFNGNNGVYKWSVKYIRRLNGTGNDELASGQGMRVRYEGYIQSDGNLEGGIKSVAFDWHPTSDKLISDFYVKVGGAEPYHHNSTGVSGTFPFSYDFNVAKNTTLSIENVAKIGTDGQAFQVIGPVTITPYLLFTKKNSEYQYTATQSLDLSTIIINNTGTTPTYTISAGASATIEDGVVKFANKEESFTVTATWGEVSTTTTIAVHALPIPTFTIADVVATMYDGTATPNPVVKVGDVEQSNPVITYTSSDENIVKVENEGKVLSILAAGEVTFTANLAASSTYQAATTTFTLTVTGIQEGDANKVKESYSNVPNYYSEWSSKTDPVDFEGDNTPYSWKVFYYKHDASKSDLDVNGAAGVMLAGKSAGSGYISATIEGGVKAVAFDWKIYTDKKDITAELYAGETLLKTMSYTGLTPGITNRYECALEQKSNVVLKVRNNSENNVYGPITIVPYLLYTVKSAEMWAKDGAYTNSNLINNTGETPTFTLEDNDDEATIDAATGAVTASKDGEVTVKASWNEGKVYTTYTLKLHLEAPNASFAASKVEKSMGDAAFTNELTKSEYAGGVSYSSSDETVATVNATGEVTIINGGTAKITASIDASAACRDTSLYYTLDVMDTPAEGTYWEETFSKCTTTSTTGTEMVIGDSAVYNWSLTNFTRNNSDLIGEKQGMRLRYPSVWTMTNPEGGIKEVVFDWYASGDQMPVHFFVKAGENEYEYSRDKVGVSKQVMHFARQFNETSNVALSLHMSGEKEDPEQTYAVVGPIKIVPYLLFTKKNSEYQYTATQSLDLSTIIINNTGVTPYYSISDGASATIEDGVVKFANKEESFTVTATRGEVSTTTTIAVHALPIPNFSIDGVIDSKMTKSMYDGTFAPTPIVKIGEEPVASPVVTYTSSDENIVSGGTGSITILAAGSVTITANLVASETHQAAETTFTLDITGIEEDAEDMIQEKYEGLTKQSEWYQDVVTYTGKQGYEWSVKYYQFGGQKIGDIEGVRLAQHGFDNYISAKIEGGVKALAFDWMLPTGVSQEFAVQISMDSKYYSALYPSAVPLTTPYSCEIPLEVKKNATLKIVNGIGNKGPATIYGPITIVPYLLYTNKEVSINPLENSTYTNTALINNIPEGGTVTYSIENQGQTEVDAIAVINAETGEITVKNVGTVKVIATWGDVTTSYLLTVELPTPVISGLVATTIDLDGGSYTPSLTATIGEQTIEDAVFELTSSDLTKAIVQNGTTFVPVANGSANMTATLKAGTFRGIAYESVSLSNIALTINAYTPEANFVETFSNLETGESTETTDFNGDNNVYTWSAHNYTKSDDAIVINTADGSLSSKGVQEGGIKYMTFKWLASEKATEAMGFVVTMNGESATYHFNTAQRTTDSYTWERMFNAKQNSQFSITLEEGSSKGVKIMDAEITIVPYLLYTEKNDTIEIGQTFTNEALINNLGEETITYSIVSGSEYATIDGDEITAIAEGDVVVKASWNEGQITTTYNLHINPMSALVISEEDEDLATLVEEKEGQTLDVTLQRTMVADGAYSTIFLPFAMSTTQIAAVFGEGTQVAQLLSSELVGDLLTFNFDFVTEMSAGVPYLINPTQNVSEANIANVTIVKPEEPVTVEEGKFHGILAKQPAMDIDGLYFLGDDNILVTYPEIHEQEVQGLRAYFTLANPTPQLVARCVIGHTHPTILPLVDGKPVVGVKKVIINNQMIIIRNTEMYNAQGNKIQ